MKRISLIAHSYPSRAILATALLLSILQVCGCSTVNSRVGSALGFETDLRIRFNVGDNVNPDENWTPSPVYLRFYELTDAQALADAEFLDLYAHDQQILAEQLVDHQTLRRFAPGESRVDEFVIGRSARFVALYAEFYHYQKAIYKIILPVTPHNVVADSFVVSLHANRLEWQRN